MAEQSRIENRKSKIPMHGYLFVAAAACLWGSIGLLLRALHNEYGLPELAVAFLRPAIALALLLPTLALFQPRLLKVPWRTIPFFAAYGLGAAAYNIFYVQAVVQVGVTTAAILLYTAPAFVSLCAWRLWGEPLNTRKMIAIGVAFAGCWLVVRGYDVSQLRLNAIGVVFGLGAGFTYALYSLFSKAAMREHSPLTALTYVLLFAAIFLGTLQSPAQFEPLTRQPAVWLVLLALALGPTIGALILFNLGLQIVPASNASVIATIEPVVAALLAFALLGERLEFLQLVGGTMILAGALILSVGSASNGGEQMT